MLTYWIIGIVVTTFLFSKFVNRKEFVDYLQQSMEKCGIESTNKKVANVALFLTFIFVSLTYPYVIYKILTNE